MAELSARVYQTKLLPEGGGTGTVRLRRTVDRAGEMALDTAGTKTTRVRAQA